MQSEAAKTKVDYINNLRVLMTVLVILHHTLIAYGAPGGWYFRDPTTKEPALIIMTVLVATNQSFFMGFFFFLSAYFTEPSYLKKGASRFLADRLKRLGIPLLFYTLILGPVMNFLIYKYGLHKSATFTQYITGYDNWIDFGVLWFVAALLLFTGVYVLIKKLRNAQPLESLSFPTNTQIFLFALALGIASYLVRIFFPVGWVLRPLGFQLGYFPQYIALFSLGIIASRNGWMTTISYQTGRRWLAIALLFLFIMLPVLFLLLHGHIDKTAGGGTWQSGITALWEQLTGISIIVALSGISRQRWNDTTPLLQKATRAAFATYIFHPLIVISLTLCMLPWGVDPVVKLSVAAPGTVILSFTVGWLITKLPLAKEIF